MDFFFKPPFVDLRCTVKKVPAPKREGDRYSTTSNPQSLNLRCRDFYQFPTFLTLEPPTPVRLGVGDNYEQLFSNKLAFITFSSRYNIQTDIQTDAKEKASKVH